MMKTLVAGWFSFPNGHATAGDLLTRDLACKWLEEAGCAYDVAVAPPFEDGIDWHEVDADAYSTVVFVCGPFEQGELEAEFLGRFHHCRLIGLNLSMRVPVDEWQPFDLLIERDSSARVQPDMAFGTRPMTMSGWVPVVGVCLVEEYPGAHVAEANRAIQRLIASREMAVVPVDTRLDANEVGLRTPGEIEALLARMDVVITTRLHGTVLALKNGVPVVAIDPETGGAKICRQAARIGWPIAFAINDVTDAVLADALDFCLTGEARTLAQASGARAAEEIAEIGKAFVASLTDSRKLDAAHAKRLAAMAAEAKRAAQQRIAGSQHVHAPRLARAWQWLTRFAAPNHSRIRQPEQVRQE